MSTKPGTRLKKPRQTKVLSSPRVTLRILVILFVVLPIITGLVVARWFEWGIDGALFGVMTGGIVVAVLLLGVLRLHKPYQTRKPGRASR